MSDSDRKAAEEYLDGLESEYQNAGHSLSELYKNGFRDGHQRGVAHARKELEQVAREAWEACLEREQGMLVYDHNSGYGSTDPEMRGCRYVEGAKKYSSFADYWQQRNKGEK